MSYLCHFTSVKYVCSILSHKLPLEICLRILNFSNIHSHRCGHCKNLLYVGIKIIKCEGCNSNIHFSCMMDTTDHFCRYRQNFCSLCSSDIYPTCIDNCINCDTSICDSCLDREICHQCEYATTTVDEDDFVRNSYLCSIFPLKKNSQRHHLSIPNGWYRSL